MNELDGNKSNKRIWMTWENQRRNVSLSAELGAKLFVISINANRFIRYPISIIKKARVFFIFILNLFDY